MDILYTFSVGKATPKIRCLKVKTRNGFYDAFPPSDGKDVVFCKKGSPTGLKPVGDLL